jgi:TRAP-type C4-dicarboxylate transport system permease small subunit
VISSSSKQGLRPAWHFFFHWEKGNVLVEFCTANLPKKVQHRLDCVGNLLVAIFACVILWRVTVGLLSARAGGETGMVGGMPLWWGYVPLLPGFALLALNAAFMGVREWRAGR